MPDPATVSARPDRLRAFRVTAGEIADGLVTRRAALLDALHAYEGGTEPAFRAPARGGVAAVGSTVSLVRELGGFVGAVGDAFAAVSGDEVVDTTPATIEARLPRSAVGFGEDLLEQWDASRGDPLPDRAARSVLDAAIEGGLTIGGGLLGGTIAVAACRGSLACRAPGMALGQQAGHWLGERLTDLVGLGDEPEPGRHGRHEVRDDVAELDGDEEEAVDAFVGEARQPGAGW